MKLLIQSLANNKLEPMSFFARISGNGDVSIIHVISSETYYDNTLLNYREKTQISVFWRNLMNNIYITPARDSDHVTHQF